MPFNDLHADIIEIIFYVHVHINQGSRRSLLLTCHRWHSVAINYTSLWRSILWCSHSFTPSNPAECRSIRGLAYLIARTGNATFDLSLGWWLADPTREDIDQFIASVEPNWLSRCRFLTLTINHTYVYSGKIDSLFLRGSFEGLEWFTWHHPSHRLLSAELSRLIDHIGATAPRLREVEVACLPCAAPALSQLFCILGRIRRLKIICTADVPALWRHLTNIEHVDAVALWPLFSTFPTPNLTSLVLQGHLELWMLPSTEILEKLTRLTIRSLKVPGSNKTSLYLPSVQYLACEFSPYLSYSGTLHANKLEELTLADTCAAHEPILRFGPGVAPRIVNLYMPHNGAYKLQSLEDPFWIRMTELHVTVFKVDSHIAVTVAGSLRAGGFAPQLRCFTVRYASSGPPQKREWVNELRRIMAERVSEGMKPFERLDVGWFNRIHCTFSLEELTKIERFTHWTDCLQE